jgi:hypothetical protein
MSLRSRGLPERVIAPRRTFCPEECSEGIKPQ